MTRSLASPNQSSPCFSLVPVRAARKAVKNTEIHTHLVSFRSDEYHVALVKNFNEEAKLIEAGFEHVGYSDTDKVSIYQRRR